VAPIVSRRLTIIKGGNQPDTIPVGRHKVMMMNSVPLKIVKRESREEELHELYTELIISNKGSCRNSK
jgi:hypothetical protein